MPRVRPPRPRLPAPALIRLLWLASPALPVGGFSYSEALEAAIEDGLVHDEASTATWLADQLALVLGRADLAVVARAHGAWRSGDTARLTELNDWVRLTRDGSEARQQTEQMGRSLLDWLRQRAPQEPRIGTLAGLAPAPTWPLAYALAGLLTGAPLREVLIAHGFGWAENMVQAALKTVPLGQSAGQRVLAQLADALPTVVDLALALPDGDRQAFAPMLAVLAARHEAQYSRLFRS